MVWHGMSERRACELADLMLGSFDVVYSLRFSRQKNETNFQSADLSRLKNRKSVNVKAQQVSSS